MKILFAMVAPPDLQPENCSDYQLDTLLHGLVKNGHNIETFHDHWWMYESEKKARPKDFKKIWGKGFTVYGNLSDEEKLRVETVSVDSISSGNYDAVIVGLHHTNAGNDQVLFKFVSYICSQLGIESRQIIVVDGWDRPHVNKYIASNTKYFKRELYPEHEEYCIPISFGFPREKIYGASHSEDVIMLKKHDIAPLIPVNQSIDPSFMSTYIYNNEEDYYQMYRDSEFGLTSKKGGWDTLRHYEMVANGCVPLFVDIEDCPNKTLHLWPKELLIEIKKKHYVTLNYRDGTYGTFEYLKDCSCVDIRNPGKINVPKTPCYAAAMMDDIHWISGELVDWLKTKGTTEYLAEYVLNHA